MKENVAKLARSDGINLPDRIMQAFHPDDQGFLGRMYEGNLDRYDARIRSIEFCGLEHVLDAGCGFGQWTLRLAKYNARVAAFDIDAGRLLAAQQIAEKNNIENVDFQYGTHTGTGYPNAHFDAVFCYGSVFLTDEGKAVKEFHRVLKKGGKLYFNYNGLGTYLYFLIDKGIKEANRYYLDDAVSSIGNTIFRRRSQSHIISDFRIRSLLKKYNFDILSQGADGHVSGINGNTYDKPLFMNRYLGFGTLKEVLAIKKD